MIEQKFTCKNGENTIRGYYYLPENAELRRNSASAQSDENLKDGGNKRRTVADKYPTIILSHGFGGTMEKMKRYGRRLTEKGYASICFDFCGGSVLSQSDGSPKDMTVLTEKEDLRSVYQWAMQQKFTDPNHVILLGGSQGGFVASLLAGELQEKIEALILLYPAFCIPDDSGKGHVQSVRLDPENLPDTFEALGMTLSKDYVIVNRDLKDEEIYSYKGRTLICHGDGDAIVPVSYAVAAAEKFKDAELHILKGADHGFNNTGMEDAIRYTLDFLGQ